MEWLRKRKKSGTEATRKRWQAAGHPLEKESIKENI